ncbi:hypothetical protein ACP70R_044611 [Stipagrostis hirtigluma subsp. patula]
MNLLAFTAVLLLFLWLPSCASDDQLVLGKPLSPGDVIVSDDGTFALGFFSPTNSTPAKLYLGIWYHGIPNLTVVWVANREAPITDRPPPSTPTLALTNTSNLVLADASGRVVWATEVAASSSPSVAGVVGTTAKLRNTGNFVIQWTNGTVLAVAEL